MVLTKFTNQEMENIFYVYARVSVKLNMVVRRVSYAEPRLVDFNGAINMKLILDRVNISSKYKLIPVTYIFMTGYVIESEYGSILYRHGSS